MILKAIKTLGKDLDLVVTESRRWRKVAWCEAHWLGDQTVSPRGVSSDRSHHRGITLPNNWLPGTTRGSQWLAPTLLFKMGLFPAIDCIKLIVIAFTRENDLFKKLKQWLWQPQFSRRNVFGEVLLGDRGFSSVLRDSECTEDVSA